MTPPRIFLGPDDDLTLRAAIEEAGGELTDVLEDADAVVWNAGKPDELPALPEKVRWVQLPSAGVEQWQERIGAEQATFTSATGAYAIPTAEHALTLLLAAVRQLKRFARAASWDPDFGGVLEGSTVGIVGAGGIGAELISMLAPHAVEIVAVTRSGRTVDGAAHSLAADDLDEFWGAVDHVVLAAPATAQTRHLVGAPQLAAMRSHAVLVNIARGSLVDTDALVEALRNGTIAGAALDVTDPEPLPDGHPLWELPNALVTPHVANPPDNAAGHLARRVTENVRRFADGSDSLIAPVDRASGY